jgi:hypothetical protein
MVRATISDTPPDPNAIGPQSRHLPVAKSAAPHDIVQHNNSIDGGNKCTDAHS